MLTLYATNLNPFSDAIVFRVDSVGILWICSVTGACNQCGWSIKRLAEVGTLVTKTMTCETIRF